MDELQNELQSLSDRVAKLEHSGGGADAAGDVHGGDLKEMMDKFFMFGNSRVPAKADQTTSPGNPPSPTPAVQPQSPPAHPARF